MNKKLVFKNNLGKVVYCVLNTTDDMKSQLETIFAIQKGYGFTVDFDEKHIHIVDYFHGETRASFDVISFEDTNEDVNYQMNELK